MGGPDDLGVDSPTIPRDQDAMARPRPERARSSSLGALNALNEAKQLPHSTVAQQEEDDRLSNVRDARDGTAPPSVGLGLSGVGAEQLSTPYDGRSSRASSESSSPDLASTSSLATPLYHTPPADSEGFANTVDSAFATPRQPSEPSPTVTAPNPPSPTVPVSPTPTLHIARNPLATPSDPLPVPAPSLSPSRDKRGSLTLEERLSNLELSPPRLALVGEDTVEEMAGTSRRSVQPLERVSESSSSSAELRKELELEEKEQQGRARRKDEQATSAHARLLEALENGSSAASSPTTFNSTSPPPSQDPSPRPSSSSLGSSPSNPLPARPERSTPPSSTIKSPPPSHSAAYPSLPSFSSPPHLSHSASTPSLRTASSQLSPSKPTSKADKRSSILSFVGFGSLGRKKGSSFAPPVASPPKMSRSPSAQSYEFGSSRSTLEELHEMDDDECAKEDDFVAVGALPSAPTAEVRLISNKASALLGLQAIGEGSPTSPPRSLPMSPSTSKDSIRSHRSKLQRASSPKEEREKERRARNDSGTEFATMHTYVHDPLPPFPCVLAEVLEHEQASDTLHRHAPPEHHHTSFLRSHHRPSPKDWRPQQLYLSGFPSPLSEPPTSIPSLHLFKPPAARNDREIARLELTRDSVVCVPEDESSLALGGSGKVNYALKVTGLATRESDERGRPVDGERKRTSWILGMEKVEQMARWLKVLKAAVHELPDEPSAVSPRSSITRSPSVETGLTERQRRERQPSWQSNASAQSSSASVASSMFFDSGPRMDRRPSESSQTPSTPYSLSPPPLATRSPSSRKTSSAGLSLDDASHDPLPRATPSQLYINAHLPSPPLTSADDAEELENPGTAHPYRMALPPPQPRPSSRDSHSKRLSVLSSAPRPSEDSISTSTTNTTSSPPRRPNRDSTSLSSLSSRTTSSSHKHPPRPPAPTFALPPAPPSLPRPLPSPLPRTASDSTSSGAEKRLSVISTSTNASSTSNSSGSLRSRLSGAPLPPQLPPPLSTNLPLPPTPAGETPYKGVNIPLRVQRASSESITEFNEAQAEDDEGAGLRKDARAATRGSRSAPPDFATRALPPPPPQFALGALPPPPMAPASMAGRQKGSVKGLVQRWEKQ
ncbi:hypothetical protein BCR35DRAFT_307060 [Leucosporidium creatinivorum]|uniref:Uncharacterized protein n=1 Tax=Leucosporidium creatinivorum TaxID=106004 RepID=A0A1Y2EPT6_9BASI|nr:hypothetical protein BCR35DRAFT_307060 [Leucosporidium creatinivorum]